MSAKERIVLRGKENYEVWKYQYGIFKTGMKEKDKMKFIASSVTENVLRKLTTCRTSREMEEKLELIFGVDVMINKLYLQNKFYTLQCSKDNVTEFMEEVDNIADKLQEAGETLSDEMKVAKVLNSLPKSYESFVTAFECANSEMKFETLRMKLAMEKERKNLKTTENVKLPDTELEVKNEEYAEEKVFVTRKQNTGMICNYCKKSGHFLKDCLLLKKKNENMKCYKCNNLGHIARYCPSISETNSSEIRTNLAAIALNINPNQPTSEKKQWIVDSGATQHMVFDKNLFVTYKSVTDMKVCLPDGNMLAVEGLGEIKLTTPKVNLTLQRVLHVPGLKFNLMAAKPFTNMGVKLLFEDDQATFLINNESIMKASFQNGLYVLDCQETCFVNLTLGEWHVRMGHQNLSYVKDILANHGISYKNEEVNCHHCKLGKSSRKPFPHSNSWANEIGDLIHMDVGGPMEVASLGGNRYYLLLRDDYSNWRTVYFLKTKSQVKDMVIDYLKWFKNQTGKSIKRFRSDNGLEECNATVGSLFIDNGIIHERSCPYTPEQNGRIERDNRTVIECARTMLISGNLNKALWAEATNAAVFILNRTGRTRIPGRTPQELFFNRKSDLKFLKPYGASVFVHVPKIKRKKWDATSKKGVFVGYDEEVKGYRIYFPDNKRIEIHRDVSFVTNGDVVLHTKGNLADPLSYEEIENRPDSHNWKTAIRKELNAMLENEVWEITTVPCGKEVLDSKWVFKVKPDGEYKARLVVRGCFQKNLDENELYAPVVKMETVRILLSIAVKRNFVVHQMDVNTAFLNGSLHEEVYMEAPKGLQIESGHVLKLKKSIYGLRQAPRCWNQTLNSELTKLGFKKSEYDECLYLLQDIYLIVYVDDLLLMGQNEFKLEQTKTELKKLFSMKDMGKIETFLGICFDKTAHGMSLSQKKLIESSVEKFGLDNSRVVKTPMEKDLSLKPEENDFTKKPYRELLGTLNYIMSGTRPDISFCINYLSRFQECAGDTHYSCLQRVLKYLKGTADLKLMYNGDGEEVLSCDVDASWAESADRKSTSGYVLKVFGNVVIWKTKKQSTIALSSAEAEYIALYECLREIVWVKGLLQELNIDVGCVKVLEDNSSCISIANNHAVTKRTKHMDVKYHYVKEKVEDGTISLIQVASVEQSADGFTKSLGNQKFMEMRNSLNLY